MKKFLLTILFCAIALSSFAQSYLSPQQKAVLDFYYAQALTNSIDGSWIIDGTITTNKLSTNLQNIVSAAFTNVVFAPADSNAAYAIGHDLFIFSNTNEADKTEYNIFTESNKFQNIEIAGGITSVDWIQFSGGTGTQGKLSWNIDEETLDIILNGAILQTGLETMYHVKNQTGSTINDGTPVYANGVVGASGRITIAPYIADGTIPAHLFLGSTTEELINGDDGKVTHFGKVRGISSKLTGFSDADILYPSETTAGEWTNAAPAYPNIALPTAFIIDAAPSGTIHVRVNNLDENEFATYEQGIAGMVLNNCLPKKGNRPTLDWTVSGGIVTGIVDVVEADNELTIVFDETDYSFATPVYLQLDNGATNVQQFQYIYCTANGITNSTTFPSGEYAMLFDLSLLDAASTASDGVFTLRRWTDNASGPGASDGRSIIQRATERIRAMPATWISGGSLTATVITQGGADDDVYITSDAGTSYQFNPQSFSAVSATNGTEEYHIYNDPDTTYTHITNLNQITKDSSGNTVLNSSVSYFNVAVMRHFPSGTTNNVDSKLILKLSSDDYADEDRALADADGLLDFTVPSRMAGETLVLGFVTLNRTSPGGGTWTATVTSRLGQEVGTAGGGSTSLPAANTFIDSAFRVQDDTDPTKKISFEVDQLTTATTREYTWPDKDGKISLDIANFRAIKSDAQTINNSTPTKMTWGTELWDVGGGYDNANDQFEPPVNGKYFIGGMVRFTNLGDGNRSQVLITTNGVTDSVVQTYGVSSVDDPHVYYSVILNLTTNDTVTIYANQASGGTMTMNTTAINNTFFGYYIGE